jgi:CheY-like chemotaxis protein
VEQNKSLKVLIVEDDETSDLLMEIMLRKYTSKILHAQTGKEALEILERNPEIDLILMDIQMPELNGYEATRAIRGFNKDVIIIAQTAYALSGEREKALAEGCNHYFAKPIDQAMMTEVITTYFNGIVN